MAAIGGVTINVFAQPELAYNLLPVLGGIVSIATTVYFQVLRRVEETREKAILDEPQKSWLRKKLDARKGVLFRRWMIAFTFGLISAGLGVALRSYPVFVLIVVGYALLGLAILSVILMALEFKMISDLATKLQDAAEERKKGTILWIKSMRMSFRKLLILTTLIKMAESRRLSWC